MPKVNSTRRAIQIILVILAIGVAVLVFFFIRQSIIIHREKVMSARELWITNFFKARGAPTAADVAIIAPWMTFDYVNRLFKVPPTYLQQQLSISDPSYPHITIASYAHYKNMDEDALVANIDQALVRYLAPVTPTSSHI